MDECFLGFAPDARERSVAARAACSHHVAVLSAFTKLAGVAVGISDQRKRPTHRGIRRAGQAWPVPSVARLRASPPWRTSNTSRRAMYWRASERGFPRALLARAFRRAVGCELPFSPHAGERHPRAPAINRGFGPHATRFRYCPVSGAALRCARARRTPGLRWRSAARFGRKAHRAKANPTNGAALLVAGAMAGADGRRLGEGVDTRG